MHAQVIGSVGEVVHFHRRCTGLKYPAIKEGRHINSAALGSGDHGIVRW